MQRWHLILRVSYFASAALLGLAGGLLLSKSPTIGQFFFAVYVMWFALLICCFEIGLSCVARLIAINFGFLYTMPGKLAFLLFVGFMSFSLELVGQIAMAVLYACYIFQIFIYCKFPRFEEYLRKTHYFKEAGK